MIWNLKGEGCLVGQEVRSLTGQTWWNFYFLSNILTTSEQLQKDPAKAKLAAVLTVLSTHHHLRFRWIFLSSLLSDLCELGQHWISGLQIWGLHMVWGVRWQSLKYNNNIIYRYVYLCNIFLISLHQSQNTVDSFKFRTQLSAFRPSESQVKKTRMKELWLGQERRERRDNHINISDRGGEKRSMLHWWWTGVLCEPLDIDMKVANDSFVQPWKYNCSQQNKYCYQQYFITLHPNALALTEKIKVIDQF